VRTLDLGLLQAGASVKGEFENRLKSVIEEVKASAQPIIMFIDEPYLVSVGSSFVSIKKEDVIKQLNEIISAIHKEGAFAGVHCCGNTDWSILLDTDIDILNFDAYDYLDALLLYPDRLKKFFAKGGVAAPGIVPTSEKIEQETSEKLSEKLKAYVDKLAAKGIDKELITKNSIITPSCGCGSLPEELTEIVLSYIKKISR